MSKLRDYINWTPAIPSSVPPLEQEGEDDRMLAVITTIKAPAVAPLIRVEEVRSITERLRAMSTLPLPIMRPKASHTSPDYTVWLVLVIASITSICATIYFFQHHDILLYGDSFFHLRAARRVFDSATPGVSQLGTTWLPLPHLLMIPFIWNDYLWRTGLAGSIPSMICYVVAALYLFLSGRRLTKNSGASFIGTLIFLFNPNILYLQSTPLSELVCIATLTITCYYFLAWTQENKWQHLVFAAGAAFLTTLARYDGWALFMVILVLVPMAGLIKRQMWGEIQGNFIIFSVLGGLGIELWIIYNQVLMGDPLYFEKGPYSSKSQTIGLGNSHAPLYTYHNIWESIRFYSLTTIETIGLGLCIISLIAFLVFVIRKRMKPEVLGTLTYLSPLPFYILSIYTGDVGLLVPGAAPLGSAHNQLFNARFGAEMVIPTAIFMITFLDFIIGLPKLWRLPFLKYVWFTASSMMCIAVILIQTYGVITGGIISLEDGLYGVSCEPTHTINTYLAEHYNGGMILEELFNSPVDGTEANFDFKNIIWEGSYKLWTKALINPASIVDWIIINPSNHRDVVLKHLDIHGAEFQSQFTLVQQEDTGLQLYHKNGLSSLPNRSVPSYISTELQIGHQYCGTNKLPPKGGW